VGAENLMGSMTSLPCGVKKLDRERKPGRLLGSVGARPQRSPDLIDEKRTAGTIETATSSRSMGTGSLPSSRRNSRPVIDWKIAASETSDYSPQLRVYALALARVRGMSPEDIARLELFEVNLLRNEIHYEVASPEVVEETEDFVF